MASYHRQSNAVPGRNGANGRGGQRSQRGAGGFRGAEFSGRRGGGGNQSQAPILPRRPPGRARLFPRETSEELHFRQSVMRSFKCPFKEEDKCRYETTPKKCIFGHAYTELSTQPSNDGDQVPKIELANTPHSELKDIPPYACVYSLINTCNNYGIIYHGRKNFRQEPMDTDDDQQHG